MTVESVREAYNKALTYTNLDDNVEATTPNIVEAVYEYYFMDIMSNSLEGRIQTKIFYCEDVNDTSPVCTPELLDTELHVASSKSSPLGGYFTIEYPASMDICRGCKHGTDPISVYASAKEVEESLESLDLIGDVEVTVTESERFEEYKVPVESGVVGANRNFYIHFLQTQFSSSNLDGEKPLPSTSYTGDIPLLVLNERGITGEPTRDSAYSQDYRGLATEIVKGTELNHGGTVEVAISLNGGVDFSKNNPSFEYKPVPIVQGLTPAHGSIYGGTRVRVVGYNFSKESVKSCLFWGRDVSVYYGNTETVPISTYVSSTEVVCTTPAWMKSQDVSILVIANEDIPSLGNSLHTRGQIYHYHEQIEIVSVHPESSKSTGNVTVEIFGGPFIANNADGFYCMFGDDIVPAKFVTITQITCRTPTHAAGAYSIEVTQNGQDYTQYGRVFRFYHESIIHRIQPAFGPANQAGTNVKVCGESFINSTSFLLCRFGTVVVPATFVDSTEIRCSSPPVDASSLSWLALPDQRHDGTLDPIFPWSHQYPRYSGSLVSFEITNNGQDYTASGVNFLYQRDVAILKASRVRGPSSGGTPIFISGSNFGKLSSLRSLHQ